MDALYDAQPLQCGTCALRFPKGADAQLLDHYDWHFRRNTVPSQPPPPMTL